MILLIRHGKTRANEEHLYCGSTDLPLSPDGAAHLHRLPAPNPGTLFITSGMLRTRQTLEKLYGPVSFQEEPDLREIDFGSFEMHSYEELKNQPDYQAWLSGDNRKNTPPGGESGFAMEQRVITAFHRLSNLADSLVIVTHGGVIATIMSHLFPDENKNLYTWQPDPGYGYMLQNGHYFPFPEYSR